MAEVFALHATSYAESAAFLSRQQEAVLRAIVQCRTAALGGHVEKCDQCGFQRVAYNSCRNRHCPKCQSLTRECWLQERKAELLPVEYFHVVFTVPDTIAAIALQNQRVIYDILFRSAGQTLRRIAADPRHLGAEIGYLAVLHTWGQNLSHHPHVHCVVPGGGLSPDGESWVSARKGFFLPVRVLSRLFRGLFLDAVRKAFEAGRMSFSGSLAHLSDPQAFYKWLESHWRTDWVVYCKRPFAGPAQVLEYLGRYTHRVAISNHRLVNVSDTGVAFRWKDYRHHDKQRTMCLHPHEFMRRFLQHVLPPGFVRLRHGGFLGNCHRRAKLARCRELLQAPEAPAAAGVDWKTLLEQLTGRPIDLCPNCDHGRMTCVDLVPSHPLPLGWPWSTRLDSS